MFAMRLFRKGRSASVQAVAVLAALSLVCAPASFAERTRLKPGFNMYSPQQDVEIGKQVSAQAEKELQMLNDARVDRYLDRLGKRLASKATGEAYPYQFKAVNDMAINAFALPGGFMYVNRGTIEAAQTEGQLAGVMAHEISHVALRHGTNQASKAGLAQSGLGALGIFLGGGGAASTATLIGAGFLANSVLLKYSRDAERQADVLGTQILYDNGYDPRGMSQFFEIISAQSKSGRPPEFFSSHPNPDNRSARVNEEIEKLGGSPGNMRRDSAEFQQIKRYVSSLPKPAAKKPAGSTGGGASGSGSGSVPAPSSTFVAFQNRLVRLNHPDNWQRYGEADAVWFVPEGGAVKNAVAYGAHVSLFEPHDDRYGQITLETATDQLVQELRESNRNMRVAQQHERIRVGGYRGLSTVLSNDSPLGGRETDWLVTVLRPDGLVYFVFVAPDRDFDRYERAFEQVLDSVRFR